MKKIISAVVRAGVVLLAVGAVVWGAWRQSSQVADPSGKPVVKIGMIVPMSGNFAPYGRAMKSAADLFFEELKEKNPHFEYQLIWEDNQYSLARTAALVRKLVYVDKADAVVNYASGFGKLTSPTTEKEKRLHFTMTTDPEAAKGAYSFSVGGDARAQARLLHDTLVQAGARKVDVVQINTDTQISKIALFKELTDKSDALKINKVYTVNPDEKDYRILLMKIKRDNPDYIIVMATTPSTDIFLKQYHEANMDIPVTAIESFSYLRNKRLAEGQWFVVASLPQDSFYQKYTRRTGSDATYQAEYMYSLLQAMVGGYEGAKSKDIDQVADYIARHTRGIDAPIGRLSITAEGAISSDPLVLIVKNGEMTRMEKSNEASH